MIKPLSKLSGFFMPKNLYQLGYVYFFKLKIEYHCYN